MSELHLRSLTGNYGSAHTRQPGEPGTRRHNRLNKIAEHYTGKSPVQDALAAGTLDIPLVRQVEEKLGMAVFGPPAEAADPAEMIMTELQRSAGHVRDLENIIRQFEQTDLIETDTIQIDEEKNGGGENGDYTLTRTEKRRQISLIWNLYERERKHLSSVASAAVKAGLELRRVRIAEAQLDRMQAAILLAMSDLGIDTGDSRVRTAIGTRLQELQSGGELTPEPIPVVAERATATKTPPPPPADF